MLAADLRERASTKGKHKGTVKRENILRNAQQCTKVVHFFPLISFLAPERLEQKFENVAPPNRRRPRQWLRQFFSKGARNSFTRVRQRSLIRHFLSTHFLTRRGRSSMSLTITLTFILAIGSVASLDYHCSPRTLAILQFLWIR